MGAGPSGTRLRELFNLTSRSSIRQQSETLDVCFGSCVDGALARTFCRRCSIGRVRSCVRPVCAAVKPLAIMLCADRVPIVSAHFKSAMTQTGSPDPRIDLVCITSSCPRQFLKNLKTPSSLPGLTSLNRSSWDVRFPPKSGCGYRRPARQLRDIALYSITSSALASS
jgi:hypothetical protein